MNSVVKQSKARKRWALLRLKCVTLAVKLKSKVNINEKSINYKEKYGEIRPLLNSADNDNEEYDSELNNNIDDDINIDTINYTRLLMLMGGLVILGAANGILYKWVLNLYGSRYAFFVDQGNNFNYIVFSGVALWLRIKSQRMLLKVDKSSLARNEIIDEDMMKRVPQYKFVLMGILDGLGTFLSAVGGVYTPGYMQTLLNQLLIPFTMIISYFLLKNRYSNGEVFGALIILLGAILTVVPSMNGTSDSSKFRWSSAFIYISSNIPMAFSAIWKQWGFQNQSIDCYFLTFCVGTYQMLVSFAFAPALALPGFGGIALSNIPQTFYEGSKCWLGINSYKDDNCTSINAIALSAYTFINFTMNMFGLFLTKEFSAAVSSLGYAVKLPVTNIAFAMCFMIGNHLCEPFTFWSALGLIVVLIGFTLYSYYMRRERHELLAVDEDDIKRELSIIVEDDELDVPDSFQDRIVGMGMAHG